MALSKVGKNQVDQSASLTVDSDLTVDTTTLHVDSTNNRVGIGTSNPSTPLDVTEAGGSNWIAQFQNTSATSYGVNVAEPSGASAGYPLFRVGQGYSPYGDYLRVDTGGRVTMPYQPSWNTRSYGHTNSSSGATRVGSTDNGGTISFTTQVGNGLNNGRFTAPVTGTYWVHVNGADGSAGNAGLQIWKNGSSQLSSTAYLYTVSYNGTGVSAAIQLNANDYVEGKFVHFNSVNSALYDGSFSGFLIG